LYNFERIASMDNKLANTLERKEKGNRDKDMKSPVASTQLNTITLDRREKGDGDENQKHPPTPDPPSLNIG
jgi:hypothetical protein